MNWNFSFYNEALAKEVMNLPRHSLAKVYTILCRLKDYGMSAQRMPHMRHLQDGLWEVRAIAADGSIRIFYCWVSTSNFVLLHMFKKKSQETPKHELEKALKRMKEVQNGQ